MFKLFQQLQSFALRMHRNKHQLPPSGAYLCDDVTALWKDLQFIHCRVPCIQLAMICTFAITTEKYYSYYNCTFMHLCNPHTSSNTSNIIWNFTRG